MVWSWQPLLACQGVLASLLVKEGWPQERCSGRRRICRAGTGQELTGLWEKAHGGRPATDTVIASWHHHCQDVLQKRAVVSFQKGQDVFSQAPPGTVLHQPAHNHSRKSWTAHVPATGKKPTGRQGRCYPCQAKHSLFTINKTISKTVCAFKGLCQLFPDLLCLFTLQAWGAAEILPKQKSWSKQRIPRTTRKASIG